MKKKFFRIISAFLSFVMVFLLIPFSTTTVKAASWLNTIEDLDYLGNTYNMLGDEYFEKSNFRNIFNNNADMSLIKAQFDDSNASSSSQYSYITSLSEYLKNESSALGIELGVSSEASAKLKMGFAEVELKEKYELSISSTTSGSSSSSGSNQNEYMLFDYSWKYGTYTLYLNSEDQIKRLWTTDEDGDLTVLDYDFVNSLLNDDPEVFFTNYGTHLITRYTLGGCVATSYTGNFSSTTTASSLQKNVSYDKEASGAIGFKDKLDSEIKSESSNGEESNIKQGYTYTVGAEPGSISLTTAGVDSWDVSANQDYAVAIVDSKLALLPVWELLYQDEYEYRKIELEQYFNELVDEQYIELYSDYIYNPTSVVDYSGYTFIQTAEDFANISNDLDGKYVLLNNIDLGNIEWSPIGTEENPFTGILDGNGNTASGLSITKTTDGVAGLFGYNAGTIKNLTVSGDIDADATGSENNVAYIGGIAGYNGGTINNCYNLVSVNGSIVITDYENIEDYLVNETWFDTHSADIENAKSAASTTLTDGALITVGNDPIRLNGSATNVTINVSGATVPAYIVLDNVSFTGSISNVGDNSREVCIISIGESNSITGVTDAVTVNIPNSSLYICGDSELNLCGGSGADGLTGGTGSGGTTGNDGKNAINSIKVSVSVNGDVTISGGNGGKGGNGGAGSAGTTSDHPTDGSDGGNGGKGGRGAYPLNSDVTMFTYCYTVLCLKNGASGNGGKGGKGGDGGYNTWGLWCNETSGGDGGKGGNGGDANPIFSLSSDSIAYNDSLIFMQVGSTGAAGAGGSYGSKGGAKGSIVNSGSNGSIGSPGSNGNILNDDGTNYTGESATVLSSTKEYKAYDNIVNWETANNNNILVSIGSAFEQALIEDLLSYGSLENYWIGLVRRSDSGEGFDKYDWNDGSSIQVTGTGSNAVVNRVDTNNKILCNAYANFADGQPDNAGDGEKYVYISSDGQWYDGSDGIVFGYITETNIGSGSTNTIDKNAVFVGGLSGYNAGTIKNSYNDAKVSIYKAEAQNSGILTYAGGVSGYNNGTIAMVVNNGAVESFAISGSMSHYADAYAETISTTSENGTVNDYLGTDNLSAIAISANSLYGEYISLGVSAGTDVTTTIRDYWKNSELIINSVEQTDYLVSQGFYETTLDLSYNGSAVTSYTVRYNFYQPGTSTVTVVYENGSNSFTRYIPVFVVPATPVSIELYGAPKVEFIYGDDFTYKGLSVKLNYNNDTYKLIPSKNVIISEPNMNLIGEQVISVSYTPDDGVTYLSCNYAINISTVAMTSLQIVKTPDKTTYWQGETLDTTGLLVQKVMNNGTTEEISIGNAALTIDYDFSSIGTQTVTLSYNDFSATFDCTVKAVEVTGIDIISEPYKTSYIEGATLNTEGLKVQTKLSNGEVATITANDSNLSFVYDFSTAGRKTVTVKYGNYTDSFTCEVHTYEDYLKTVTNISVESVKGCAGNTITVDVVIDNNTGILAAALNINYDSALTLIDAEGGEALSSLTLTKPGSFTNPCTFAWDGINDVDATNGTILTLTFVISEEAVVGETYGITVSYTEGNVIDGAFENIELATINGEVTVIDYVPGDLNGDGVVNMADVVNLRRYIVGGYDLTINIDAADVNNDGYVNMADVVLIRRYVVGGYGVELQ